MFIDYNNINELMRGGCGHILGLFYADNLRRECEIISVKLIFLS